MATITNSSKNILTAPSGGEVFYGWMFLFTITDFGDFTNQSRNSASITNQVKS